MMKIKQIFLDNWKAKLTSLLVAVSIWYLIKSHLEADIQTFPVPGTSAPAAPRPTSPILDDALLGPLAAPIPGADDNQ